MSRSEIARRLRVALLIGLAVIPVVVAVFVHSTDRQLALQVLAGPELRALTGDVKFSFPLSVRMHFGHERYSRITYFVFGAHKRGLLRVSLEGAAAGLVVKSATFDGSPLGMRNSSQRKDVGA